MSLEASLFTVAVIARALGRAPSTVRPAFANIAPDGAVDVCGNSANAWHLPSIPAAMREEMARRAQRRRLPNIEALMYETAAPWKPAFPLAECLPADVEKAKRLKRAWEGTIDRMRSPALLPGELARRGIEDYKREFGFEITERHWNSLHDRLLNRAGDDEAFGRLEFYLDDNARRAKSSGAQADLARPAWLDEVEIAIAGFADMAKLNPHEETLLWVRTVEAIADEHKRGGKVPALKRAVTGYLFCRVPAIAKSSEAARKQVDRKYDAYVRANGSIEALKDQRADKSGFFRAPELSQEAFDRIVDFARHECGGRISQAWRVLHARGELPEEIMAYYRRSARNKSWVPKRIREALRPEVEQLLIYEHGPRQAKLSGPSIPGDWSDTFANDWYQSDDVTLNHVVWFNDPRTGELIITRGQLLLMIDVRSLKILNFVFLDSKSYDSFSIQALMKQTCLQWGLPRRGWAFERGIWANAKLIKGNQNTKAVSYEEADLGFRRYGMQFRHSFLPRGKVIERVIGIAQDMMQGEPGYIGRNEVTDRFELTQKLILDARAGRIDPSLHFHHADLWPDRLVEIFERYNDEKQFGKILNGLSPNEAYRAFASESPVIKFVPEMACLLNPYVPVTITRSGAITLKYGKREFTYCNAETGKLIGHEALVSFDPESMDHVAMMNMKRENIVIVERLKERGKTTATADDLRESHQQISSHTAYYAARHRTLKANRKDADRVLRFDQSTLNQVVDYTKKMDEARQETARKQKRQSAIEVNATAAGITITDAVKARPSSAGALESMAKRKREWLRAQEAK